MLDLAKQIVIDGEGAKKIIDIFKNKIDLNSLNKGKQYDWILSTEVFEYINSYTLSKSYLISLHDDESNSTKKKENIL